MTEDDTFLRLRRMSYQEVYNYLCTELPMFKFVVIDKNTWLPELSSPAKNILPSGWTAKEFNECFQERNWNPETLKFITVMPALKA